MSGLSRRQDDEPYEGEIFPAGSHPMPPRLGRYLARTDYDDEVGACEAESTQRDIERAVDLIEFAKKRVGTNDFAKEVARAHIEEYVRHQMIRRNLRNQGY